MRHRASRMLAATLVLVGAASCGSGGSSTTERPPVADRGGGTTTTSDATELVKRAIETSRDAQTAQFAGSFFFDAGALGTDDPASGVVRFLDGTADYTVDMQNETVVLVPEGTPPEDVRLRVREAYGGAAATDWVDVEAGKRLVAIKNVTINEPFFTGHFPGRPIMPGVLICEALVQAGGLLAHCSVTTPRVVIAPVLPLSS